MTPRTSRPLRLVLVFLIPGLAGACPKDHPITLIEIVPQQVALGVDPLTPTTFDLEARLWTGPLADRRSITEDDGYNLHWKSSAPWLKIVGHNGFKATLQADQGITPGSPAIVTVKADGKTTVPGATVTVTPSAPPGRDIVTAKYAPNQSADVVIANGIRDAVGNPCTVTLSQFARQSVLGNLVDPCAGDRGSWGTAVLATDHELVLTTPSSWTSGTEAVDVRPTQGPPRSLPVALRVMISSSTLGPSELAALRTDALNTALDDIQVTNSTLSENRTGILLKVVNVSTLTPPDETVVSNCVPGDGLTSSLDLAGVLNLYYVNHLDEYSGRTCARHGQRPQDVIYVGWQGGQSTTLVHELGHSLGLIVPGSGHSETIGGLDYSNVMTSGEFDVDPGERHRLTVGQVFRMNTDSASWFTWAKDGGVLVRPTTAPRLGCQCGHDDPAGSCPRLVDDVAPPSQFPALGHPSDCSDHLFFRWLSGDDPAAIVTGRRWREPPGTCSRPLPGKADFYESAIHVTFDNLTRPGSCPSWAAVFFRNHNLLYLKLDEPTFTWTSAADEMGIFDPLPDLLKVDVQVFFDNSIAEADVDLDRDHALATYGSSNRSGLNLVFSKHSNIGCPTAPPSVLEINLCYVAVGPDEGEYLGDRQSTVYVNHRTVTSASYFIGRALGLGGIASTHPVFAGNIMQSIAAKRGQSLTLGQVFRIHAALTPSLPDCTVPSQCPSLGAVAGP